MRILRRFLLGLLLALTIMVGVSAGAVIATQTAWFRDWLRGLIVRQGNQYLNGRLTIGRLGGNVFFGVELEDVAVTMNGEPVITLKDARLAYSVLQLLTRDLVVTNLRLNQPVIHVRREGGGWDLSRLIKAQSRESNRKGPGLPVRVDDIEITAGSLAFADRPVGTSGVDVPRMLTRLDARLSFAYAPVHYTIDISKLSFRGALPQFALNEMSGKVAVTGDTVFLNRVAIRTPASDVKVDGAVYEYTKTPRFDVHVTSDKVDIDEIARIIPSLRYIDLKPALDVVAKGPLGNLALELDVKSPAAGEMSGRVVLDLTAPQRRIAGTVHTRDINVGAIIRKPAQATSITGVTRFDLRLLEPRPGTLPVRATYALKAQIATAFGFNGRDVNARGAIDRNRIELEATALAYGARARAVGNVTVPAGDAPLGYDLRGTASNVDMRRLPPQLKVPRPASRLNVDYHVTGNGTDASGEALLRPSTLAGATLSNGTRATFTYRRGQLAYAGDGEVAGLDLQRIGEQFEIAALQAGRFKSTVNGHFTVSGSGTSVAGLRLDASGTVRDSALMGMTTPQAIVQASIANGTLRADARGQFRDFNPASLTGNKSLKGNLAGTFNVDVGLANLGAASASTSILDDLSVGGTVNVQSSSLAGVSIDKAEFDGRYANRHAEVGQLTVTGPDVQLKARGPVTFTDQGQSLLQYELATPALDRIGKLVGQPLQGAATVTGRLRGNAADLRTTGTLKGSNIGYGPSQVLNMTSQYDVELPNLDASKAAVGATTTATFLKASGLEINEITAKTAYANRSLDFETTIRQPRRSLRAAGDLLLHPDHQEVHLRDLVFQSGGTGWQLAPGTQPALHYGQRTIGLKDVRLVSGNQEVTATGTIAPAASDLQVRLANVGLANVDAMLLSDRQLGGVLNGQATITGPRDDLNVAADFSVDGGSFRQFTYQSLTGRVRYARDTIGLNVRLQENPQASVQATGSVPTALFSATAAAGPQGNAPVDLRLQSAAVDLGIIQGFTTAIQNATGTAQADVHVAGTARDPDVDGAIDVRDGAFKVVPTNVSYSALNSHVAMRGDRVALETFTITDEHGRTLTMTGDLALRAREVGAFNAKAQGKGFELLHNTLGRLTVNPALTLAGEVRQPRITGTLGVETATINIDKLLDLATSSPYSTSEQAVPVNEGGQPASQPIGQPVNQPAREAAAAPVKPGSPAEHPPTGGPSVQPPRSSGPLDAAVVDLHVTVPDDMVVKGNDIRVGQSSIGMGNVNVTIGGDLRVQKDSGGPVRLLGQVRTVRGTYDFQGRRFEIQRGGTVRFGGLPRFNPALDITATRLISGVETRVHVGGSVRRPDLTLTSTPPLDQADILSLIIFGQPSNQLGERQQVSLAQRASTIASGFVASKLAQSIGSALNLDTFEIQTASDTGQTWATVTVGEQVGQRLYVKLRQGVGADNTSEFVIDYQLTNFLRFESTMTQGNALQRSIMQRPAQSGADLIFLFSF